MARVLPVAESNPLRMRYRCWRYRFKSEVPSIHFVRHARLSGKTVLDIGANRGIYSIYMSRAAGRDGRVIAFEPQPELGEHLARVKRDFRLDNLEIENSGLSSAPATMKMWRPKVGSGSANLYGDNNAGWSQIEVPVIRLDDYLQQAGVDSVDLIKCDIEGHELDALRGGVEMLRRDMPALILECAHTEAVNGELFGFLEDLGYDGHFYYVAPGDHRSWLHKNRGSYVPARDFADYEYGRPTVSARNYLFLRRGLDPARVHAGAAELS